MGVEELVRSMTATVTVAERGVVKVIEFCSLVKYLLVMVDQSAG